MVIFRFFAMICLIKPNILMNIIKYELAFLFNSDPKRTVDAITHVYCYVEYSLLTIGVQEGILLGAAEKIALNITILP